MGIWPRFGRRADRALAERLRRVAVAEASSPQTPHQALRRLASLDPLEILEALKRNPSLPVELQAALIVRISNIKDRARRGGFAVGVDFDL